MAFAAMVTAVEAASCCPAETVTWHEPIRSAGTTATPCALVVTEVTTGPRSAGAPCGDASTFTRGKGLRCARVRLAAQEPRDALIAVHEAIGVASPAPDGRSACATGELATNAHAAAKLLDCIGPQPQASCSSRA